MRDKELETLKKINMVCDTSGKELKYTEKKDLEVLFGIDGKEVTAKKVAFCYYSNKETGVRYYVLKNSRGLFDPYQKHDIGYNVGFKFSNVNKEIFDLYLKFLKNKHKHILTNANRML